MDGFRVNLDALAKFAAVLGQMSQQSEQAATFVRSKMTLQAATVAGGGDPALVAGTGPDLPGGITAVFNTLQKKHAEVQKKVEAAFDHLTSILQGSEVSVNDALNTYAHSDEQAAANMDAQLPHTKVGQHLPTSAPFSGYHLGINPADDLLPAHAPDFPNPFSALETALNTFSPTGLLDTLVVNVTGVDIFALVSEFWGGDWQAFGMLYQYWGDLSNFSADLANNLHICIKTLGEYWEGNAADAALAYFGRLHNALQGLSRAFADLADRYHKVGETTYVEAQATSGLLSELADVLVMDGLTVGGVVTSVAQGLLDIPEDVATLVAAQVDEFVNALAAIGLIFVAVTVISAGAYDSIVAVGAPDAFPLPKGAYHFTE